MPSPGSVPGRALLSLLLLAAVTAGGGTRDRPTTQHDPAPKLNVHIVCHSHDDAGWLKTVDQYYYGANNTIQVAGVQYILDTVVQALAANPARKFVYGEMSFFMRWWAQQDEDMHALVTQLVQDGQLEFVNGGYVQQDEATAHYVAMIDQTTLGHTFLRKTFGTIPRVGWQIDPFGHSATQASPTACLGVAPAHLLERVSPPAPQDMAHRKNLTAMEMVWQGSNSLEDATVFTGNFISNYGPPEGFGFEWGCPPIMDDSRLDEYNVQDRHAWDSIDAFVEQCRAVAGVTRGPDIMLQLGSDFQYANAHLQYKNLDKLIRAVNADGRLNAFYSTPAEYVRAKHAYSGERWPLKSDDFYPYADFPHAYWTGYFTSRPASKGYIRAATSFLQAARQLEAFMGLPEGGPTTHALEEAVSLLQHHDAITGTEKQHVACDYHRRLHRGESRTRIGTAASLHRRLQKEEGQARAQPNPVDTPIELEVCDWLNITACNTTVRLSATGKGFMVVAYNPLGWSREAPLRVPPCGQSLFLGAGPEGDEMASQLVPASHSTNSLQQLLAGVNATSPTTFGNAELVFVARLPPLGYSTFFVQPCAHSMHDSSIGKLEEAAHRDSAPKPAGPTDAKLLQASNGSLLRSMSSQGTSVQLSTFFGWYNSSDGLEVQENRGQSSGAYIFSLVGQLLPGKKHRKVAQLELVRGGTVLEARQVFSNWATLVTRLYRGQPQVEVEWTVGPIPIEDGLGKEVVLVYTSDIDSGDGFWTDANGREMVKRTRQMHMNCRPSWELNVTEPVAGNYYPLTAAMYIQDADRQLAVLTDRAQGGASLRSGQMEVMVHRRTLTDDARGVGEPLNETACGCSFCNCPGKCLVVRGKHWLLLASLEEAARPRRTLQQQLNDPPLLAFSAIPHEIGSSSAIDGRVGLRRTFSLSEGHILHSNVHLLTLKDTGDSYLVRLAHLYQEGEDPGLSRPITENLNAVLQLLQYREIHELSLSGNQLRSDMLRERLRFEAGDSLTNDSWPGAGPAGGLHPAQELDTGEMARLQEGAQVIDCSSGCSNGELLVTLKPMEVRTFQLIYRPY
ncbi:hypothetical protein CHLNCDRAFT_36397 [Chlorella variabilis]|uniref:Alpha-mannosidase n=1 Tax=Chlorella variabilis TaxID=554065 RepID=E1ZKM9_CHLVA|nr:hypothetical protein CHLNCDRAFT_36397 [Chlorella variabilis]EFN53834.1 hypothetical protein CHLNCDRAFT_36397 [Chlorella variabilis]|eukprot:XP_005845936.1 hypothetical protein CHLNCDRAFT_36397 [Chlorella variabilis]